MNSRSGDGVVKVDLGRRTKETLLLNPFKEARMNTKANPHIPGGENNELIAYVVVDCQASDSLVHEVVGYQEIIKNEQE